MGGPIEVPSLTDTLDGSSREECDSADSLRSSPRKPFEAADAAMVNNVCEYTGAIVAASFSQSSGSS